MIPTSRNLEAFLLHRAGLKEHASDPAVVIIREAVELNRTGGRLVSHFGESEFRAIVGFIDMRGFSVLSAGKTPTQVRDLAAPFVRCVIDVATKRDCFVDKTIGDEVMVVRPLTSKDAVETTLVPCTPMPYWWVLEMAADIALLLREEGQKTFFSAGFCLGDLILAQIGSVEYTEWTVYGNSVNAAKRLQCFEINDDSEERKDINRVSLGAIGAGHEMIGELQGCKEKLRDPRLGPFLPQRIGVRTECLRGVGAVSFLTAEFDTVNPNEWTR